MRFLNIVFPSLIGSNTRGYFVVPIERPPVNIKFWLIILTHHAGEKQKHFRKISRKCSAAKNVARIASAVNYFDVFPGKYSETHSYKCLEHEAQICQKRNLVLIFRIFVQQKF
jgi:hypothetical protein